MKSCLIAQDPGQIFYVYNDKKREQLKEEFDCCIDQIFSKEDVLADPAKFHEVEFIFSTWTMPRFEVEEIKKCFPALKGLMYAAGSVQAFARPFLECGVQVFSSWAANAIPVAETTLALILLANKGYHMAAHYCSQKKEMYHKGREIVMSHRGNYEVKVGIIGAGMVGAEVCKLLKNHHFEVLVYDPFCSEEKAKALGVRLTSLEEIFSECEVISNHLANNEQTQGMLNYRLFSMMHDTATFINTGRGAQIVEEDLARILREKPDVCAIIDVARQEPPAEGHPFYELDNLLYTPHLAGSINNECWRMADYMTEEAQSLRNGEALRYNVTFKMLETMA